MRSMTLEFTSIEEWLAAAEKFNLEVTSWGYGSADAYNAEGERVGCWYSLHDLDVTQNRAKGWLEV